MYSCETSPENYTLSSFRSIPDPKEDTYFWHIYNFTPDMEQDQVVESFRKTISILQKAIDQIKPKGNYLKLDSTSEIEKADIVFSFAYGVHNFYDGSQCNSIFDGVGGVQAHGYSLTLEKPKGGSIHLDDSEDWLFNDESITKMLHELGHVFNLGHSKNARSLMYGQYNGVKTLLTRDDMNGLSRSIGRIKKRVYYKHHPPKGILQKILRWFCIGN